MSYAKIGIFRVILCLLFLIGTPGCCFTMSPPIFAYYLKNDTENKIFVNYSTKGNLDQRIYLEPDQEEVVLEDFFYPQTVNFTLNDLENLFLDFKVFSMQGKQIFTISDFKEEDIEVFNKNMYYRYTFHIRQ